MCGCARVQLYDRAKPCETMLRPSTSRGMTSWTLLLLIGLCSSPATRAVIVVPEHVVRYHAYNYAGRLITSAAARTNEPGNKVQIASTLAAIILDTSRGPLETLDDDFWQTAERCLNTQGAKAEATAIDSKGLKVHTNSKIAYGMMPYDTLVSLPDAVAERTIVSLDGHIAPTDHSAPMGLVFTFRCPGASNKEKSMRLRLTCNLKWDVAPSETEGHRVGVEGRYCQFVTRQKTSGLSLGNNKWSEALRELHKGNVVPFVEEPDKTIWATIEKERTGDTTFKIHYPDVFGKSGVVKQRVLKKGEKSDKERADVGRLVPQEPPLERFEFLVNDILKNLPIAPFSVDKIPIVAALQADIIISGRTLLATGELNDQDVQRVKAGLRALREKITELRNRFFGPLNDKEVAPSVLIKKERATGPLVFLRCPVQVWNLSVKPPGFEYPGLMFPLCSLLADWAEADDVVKQPYINVDSVINGKTELLLNRQPRLTCNIATVKYPLHEQAKLTIPPAAFLRAFIEHEHPPTIRILKETLRLRYSSPAYKAVLKELNQELTNRHVNDNDDPHAVFDVPRPTRTRPSV